MANFFLYLLVVVFALVCIFVLLTILLQSGKGGGLSSLGSGAGGALSDTLGASGAEKTLVKATSWAAGLFMVLALILTLWGAHLQRTGGMLIGAPPTTSTAPVTPAEPQAPTGAASEETQAPGAAAVAPQQGS